ncbi:MAG: D-alanyl-D-alanine carboxypeptidase [Firmicutes bacterium]|nr:D-alanyl-D-alanine carboxypeptidase [Bacillota bacterium]
MNKFIAVLLAAFLLAGLVQNPAAAADEPPSIVSESAVLMDAKTGQVLYEKSMHMRLYPASITKILTILLGLEKGQLQDKVTMSREAVFSVSRGSSHIALDEGEQITLEQALMAAMLPSANDASNGIAEHVSGSVPSFALLMNQRAREAGALNSNFVNPSGLPDDAHVSTAYDMAVIARAALQNDRFREIFGTVRYTIPPTNKQPESRDLWAEHRMLTTNRFYYEGVIGGKTGYTQISQNTLVTAARRGDRELIAVVMKSQNYDVYNDTIALFDYGFDQFIETRLLPSALVNPSPGAGDTRTVQNILEQNQDFSVTRLLHKSVNPGDIVIDYQLVEGSQNAGAGLRLNMRLRTPGGLMYPDLGSVYLQGAPPEDGGKPGWTSTLVSIAKVLLYLILGIAALLFILRWFFRRRRLVRYRSGAGRLGRYNARR